MNVNMDKNKDESMINEPNPQIYSIQFYFNNKFLMPIELNSTDTLVDMRDLLSTYSIIFFITSFHFELNNKALPENKELGKIPELKNEARIDIKLDLYDEYSAKLHVKKIQEFLGDPAAHYNLFGSYLNLIPPGQGESNMNAQLGSDDESLSENAKKDLDKQQENPVKSGASSEEKDDALSLSKALETSLKTFFNVSVVGPKKEKIKLLNNLTYSGFNPPPSQRKLKGDYFYLHIKTLEGTDYEITCCPTGFYVNNSNSRLYDWRPINQQIFYNLLDLFTAISPQYKEKFDEMTKTKNSADLKSEIINLDPINLYNYNKKWIAKPDESNIKSHESDHFRSFSATMNLLGLDPMTIRDWNEQTQIIKSLPKDEILQRLNRDKSYIKLHSEFIDSVVQGAKAVVDKMIPALNPVDPSNQHMYIYNYIFYSYATHTPENFIQEEGPDASATYTMANIDIRNLKLLHLFDIQGLGLLNSAIVDYKGRRVLAQSIIPGVLNSDHNICTEYGTIDEGKTLNKKEEFMEIMKKVCEIFSLEDDIEFYDGEGKIHNLAASFEIKGVRGSDRKKYLLDLMRLSPRDLNYKGEGDEYLCCVVRPELIIQYADKKYYEMAAEKMRKNLDEKTQENKEDDNTNDLLLKNQKNKEFLTKFQEIIEKDMQNKIIKFNPSLFTRAKMPDSVKFETQKKNLEDLANYIIKVAIPTFINEMILTDNLFPIDNATLSDYMHSFGINIRYLGRIYSMLNKKPIPFLLILIERIIFIRCLKHVFREYFRKAASYMYPEMIAHILNCIFSESNSNKTQQQQNQQDHEEEQKSDTKKNNKKIDDIANKSEDVINEEEHIKEEKTKKKKKKNKKNKAIEFSFNTVNFGQLDSTTEEAFDYTKITLDTLWDRIKVIANKRYQHTFASSFKDFTPLHYPLTRLAILRDICLSNGIILKNYNFNIYGNQSSNKISKDKEKEVKDLSVSLPFTNEDIIDLLPVVKHLDPSSHESKNHIDLAISLMMEGKMEEAVEQFLVTIDMIMNVFGPVHKDIAFCYTRLAQISMKNNDKKQAIFYQKQAIIILEKFYGIDHEKTAHELIILSSYYYALQNYNKAIDYALRSLYIYNLIGGECHPSGANVLTHLALIYKETGKYQDSINCLFEVLERNIRMYNQYNFKVGSTCQLLAIVHHALRDFVKANEFQERCVNIYKKLYEKDDPRITDAEMLLQKIQKSIAEKNVPPPKKETKKVPGQNKAQQGEMLKPKMINSNDNNKLLEPEDAEEYKKEKEREKLLQKLKIAKMNAKYGTRKRNDLDLLYYLNSRAYDREALNETGEQAREEKKM